MFNYHGSSIFRGSALPTKTCICGALLLDEYSFFLHRRKCEACKAAAAAASEDGTNRYFKCQECNFLFASYKALRRHQISETCKGQKETAAPTCEIMRKLQRNDGEALELCSTLVMMLKFSFGVHYTTISWTLSMLNHICALVHGHLLVPRSFENADYLQRMTKTHAPFDPHHYIHCSRLGDKKISRLGATGTTVKNPITDSIWTLRLKEYLILVLSDKEIMKYWRNLEPKRDSDVVVLRDIDDGEEFSKHPIHTEPKQENEIRVAYCICQYEAL